MWRRINWALDDPSLGAIPFVQRIKDGQVIDIHNTVAINTQIQNVMEQRFNLSMSAPITMSLLRDQLGFLSETDFVASLLTGDIHIPWDANNVTAMVLGEVIRLFQLLKDRHSVVTLGDE
jgi:hypothetical protein